MSDRANYPEHNKLRAVKDNNHAPATTKNGTCGLSPGGPPMPPSDPPTPRDSLQYRVDMARQHGFDRVGDCGCCWGSGTHGDVCPEHLVTGLTIPQALARLKENPDAR